MSEKIKDIQSDRDVSDDKQEDGNTNKPTFDAMKIYNSSSWFGLITANWIQPIINHTQENDLKFEDIGKIKPEDSVTEYDRQFRTAWEEVRYQGKYPLIAAVFKAYKWQILSTMFLSWIMMFMDQANIYITKNVMGYIDGEYDDINVAYLFVLSMVGFAFFRKIMDNIRDYLNNKYNERIVNGLQSNIYSKIFKITSATNKKYQKGDLTNLVHGDCHTIWGIFHDLPWLLNLPFLLISTIASLYLIIGNVVLFVIGLVTVSSVSMYFICKWTEGLWKKIHNNNDNRCNVLSEVVDNIKVIKMNSYTQCFIDRLMEIRNNEFYYSLVGHFNSLPHHLIHTFSHYGMIFGVFFITVFQTDVKISVPLAMTIMQLVGHVKGNTQRLPYFFSGLNERLTRIKRIQDFLNCDELEADKMLRTQDDEVDYSVKIEKSNFFWGIEEPKDDEEPKKNNADEDKSGKGKDSLVDSKDEPAESNSDDGSNETVESDKSSEKLQIDEVESIQSDDDKDTQSSNSKCTTLDKRITLKDIDISINQGEFVAIIGEVGAGKSSLLSSILGEMLIINDQTIDQFAGVELDLDNKAHPEVKGLIQHIKETRRQHCDNLGPKIKVNGSFSLIEQKPFILNDTVRENILFGDELDKDRYNRTVEACQLGRDLEIMKGGDLTEIGERGINLSGGQKARVSIARAVYANKDIVIMDDPLSALDAHVKRKVFDKVCLQELEGKTKILVTHAIDFLDRVDKIIIMDKGRIVNQGAYDHLKDDEHFQSIIKHIAKAQESDELDEDIETTSESSETESKTIKNHMSKSGTRITEREEDEDVSVDINTYVSYMKFYGVALIFFGISTVMMLIQRSLDMAKEYLMLEWIRDFSETNSPNYSKVWKIVWFSILLMIMGFCHHFPSVAQRYILDKKVFKNMLYKLMHAPINLYFDKTTSGKILRRFNEDIECTVGWLPGLMTWNFHDICRITMTICMIAYYCPSCLYMLPFLLALLGITLRKFITFKQKIEKLEMAKTSYTHTHINESIDGITTIRTFDKIGYFRQKYSDLNDRDYSTGILHHYCDNWLSNRTNLISTIFVAFSYTYFIYNRESLDTIMVALLLGKLVELQWNMCGLVHSSLHVHNNMKRYVRVQAMESIPQEDKLHKEVPTDEHGSEWMSKGHIKFDNYSVRYRPDTEVVLKGVDVDIQPGQKVGVVGRTGAGKSTLCLALCRIIEATEGRILIDGVDIAKVGLADLRDRITIIPQEPVLFENTLRFNLDPQKKCTDEQLKRIIKKAGLERLLERDGNGLDLKITSKGENLSAGEKALVCICRAAMRKSKVVLMDEATANIDVKTEETIQKLIHEEFSDATILTVAHRLNTIIKSDKIMVLSFGEVSEFDTPEALKSDPNSAFSELLAQFNK